MPLSSSGSFRRMTWKFCLCVSQPLVVDGDVGDAALDQPPRHQAGLAERVAAVAVAQVVLLLREVEDLAGIAEDQVVGLLLGVVEGGQLRVALQGVPERVRACAAGRGGRCCRWSVMPWATMPSTAKRVCAGSPPVAKGL